MTSFFEMHRVGGCFDVLRCGQRACAVKATRILKDQTHVIAGNASGRCRHGSTCRSRSRIAVDHWTYYPTKSEVTALPNGKNYGAHVSNTGFSIRSRPNCLSSRSRQLHLGFRV